jgi:transcription factor TGA
LTLSILHFLVSFDSQNFPETQLSCSSKRLKICMASHRVGLSGLPDPGPSTQQLHHLHHHHLPYASFINQEGSALDFGELEEAIVLQGLKINNDEARLPLYTGRPAATLEMFPSWPIKALHSTRVVSSRSRGESSDSGGYTISSSKTEGGGNLEATQEESNINRNNCFQEQSTFLDQKQLILHHLQTQNQQEMDHDHMLNGSPNTVPSQSQFPAAKKTSKDKRKGPAGSTSERSLDAKTLRRLAQNREAARKSRLRKKAYVQQLESSRIRLSQLEQDLQRARSQGLLLGSGGSSGSTYNLSSGAAIFDMEYARWLDDDHRHMAELRSGLHAHLLDNDLRLIVDGYVTHYDEIFRLKSEATKADVFHLITGMWATPAERCFLWMAGFRPSELIKMLIGQLDLLLTEQQVMGIYSLQHSSQQAEEALSQGLEQLQQSLVDTIAGGSLNDGMHHMVVALGKLSNLEGFVRQADNLRQQTLHQLHRVMTVRQAARCFLVIGEYYGRLRALSSLWASRPRETMMTEENSCQTTTDMQMVQSSQNQFVNF